MNNLQTNTKSNAYDEYNNIQRSQREYYQYQNGYYSGQSYGFNMGMFMYQPVKTFTGKIIKKDSMIFIKNGNDSISIETKLLPKEWQKYLKTGKKVVVNINLQLLDEKSKSKK